MMKLIIREKLMIAFYRNAILQSHNDFRTQTNVRLILANDVSENRKTISTAADAAIAAVFTSVASKYSC